MVPSSNSMTLILIDKKRDRVIFAEAGKEFVDLLFHIFSLPLGTVTKLISDEFMVGSLGNLYASVQALGTICVQPKLKKNDLLDPKTQVMTTSSESSLSFLPTRPATSLGETEQSLYCCSRRSALLCYTYYTQNPGTVCPSCKGKLSGKMTLIPKLKNETEERIGYVKEEVTFMIKDDLEVTPMSGISSVRLLNDFNPKDLGDLEERGVYVGTSEALMILKASLNSKTVLTDVFLLKKKLLEDKGIRQLKKKVSKEQKEDGKEQEQEMIKAHTRPALKALSDNMMVD